MICVTKGQLSPGNRVGVPTFRAVAIGTSGEAIGLDFLFEGQSRQTRALASGQLRHQIGLKLRAQDGCNLVYAMWRLDPRPQLEVQLKYNPGARTHAECGARGYERLSPSYHGTMPAMQVGGRYSIDAQINQGELIAWINGQLVWRGYLPGEASYISGPSGIRSDNLAYTITALRAPTGPMTAAPPRCVTDGED